MNFFKNMLVFLILFAALPFLSVVAGSAEELKGTQNPLAQEMMKVAQSQERAKVFEMAMRDVSVPEQQSFWEVYKDYALKTSDFDERRLKLLDQYMSNYLQLTAAQSKHLMNDLIALQKDEFSYRIKTYNVLSRKASPLVATRFYQVDDYISAARKVDNMGRYPIFGQRPAQ